ncbi:integrase arm-type DNA-binding domain-containing protein [Pseudomonas sp. LS1212]|uniref:tyrosine-type recombinase/integrase n=1 Tax=Pseudomonas sp. LS1212 TaxID=2972478 RepID=UPI00215BA0E4|nr:site-specific integrase [Pseudomonas sp. LS1212]UVJ42860.1 integrase arm-type DNA-binding domain-containing protein [Pseudomonas sp. LS1212]
MKRLNDLAIRSFKNAKGEPLGKQADGTVAGLYLLHGKNGSRLWRMKFFLDKRECVLSLGSFPETSLAEVRDAARDARKLIAKGVHPLEARKAGIAAQRATEACTFAAVADEFIQHKVKSGLAAKTLAGYRGALKNHIVGVIGRLPVAEIKLSDVKRVIDQEGTTPVMARYALGVVKMVLDFAELNEYVERNAAAGRRGLLPKHEKTSRKAITDPTALGDFLVRLDGYTPPTASVASALRLLALLPVRPMEMVAMRWEHLDLDRAEWSFVISKTGKDHIVALPSQALALLRSVRAQRLAGKEGRGWVFPSPMHAARHISRDSLLAGLVNGLGYQRGTISAHGLRSTFRTIAHEQLGIDPVVLELMLSHKMPGALSDTYARAQLLDQRREAAQRYANYLDELRISALKRELL